jgi:hypothetical protein
LFAAVPLRGPGLEPHVDEHPEVALGELAERDDLRRLAWRRFHRSAGDPGRPAGRRVAAPAGERDRGPSARLFDRQRRVEQAEPRAVILAGHAVPDERDLLPRGQGAEDAPRQRITGDFVHLRARLALAHERGVDHDPYLLPPEYRDKVEPR